MKSKRTKQSPENMIYNDYIVEDTRQGSTMARIRGDASKIRHVSRHFKELSDELSNIAARYDRDVGQVIWEGVSRKRFNKEYREWERDIRRRTRALAHLAQDLKRAAFRLEQADQGDRYD